MLRLDATRIVAELAGEAPIIGGVGNNTFDLVPFDRPRNFYMWNSMGMASSIGLGLALVRPDLRVVVRNAVRVSWPTEPEVVPAVVPRHREGARGLINRDGGVELAVRREVVIQSHRR